MLRADLSWQKNRRTKQRKTAGTENLPTAG
jgi:hypothetical protein